MKICLLKIEFLVGHGMEYDVDDVRPMWLKVHPAHP